MEKILLNNGYTNTLKEALYEIEETVKYTSKAGKKDETLASVIKLYGDYLNTLPECENYKYEPISTRDKAEVWRNFFGDECFTEEDFNSQHKTRSNKLESYFNIKKFYPIYAMYGLRNKPKTVELLPYLLSSFYLNCDITDGIPADIYHLCDEQPLCTENYVRNVKKFVSRFSMESFFEKFFKQSKKD